MYPLPLRNKKRKVWLPVFLSCALFLVIAWVYAYFPQLSFYFITNAFARLEKHTEKLEVRLLSLNEEPYDTLESIEQVRKLAKLTQKNNPTNALSHYYEGLFFFYELYLLLPLDDQISLMELTGRGFLPQQIEFSRIAKKSILPLTKKVILSMRRALAIQPDFFHKKKAELSLSYATLLYTGRTDLRDFRRIQETEKIELPPFWAKYREWLSIVFYCQLGKNNELFNLIGRYPFPVKKNQNKKETNGALQLRPTIANLILSHGYYGARDYIRSLKYARRANSLAEGSTKIQAEAFRMEAEIFYVQKGEKQAQKYFERAYLASEKKDVFIQDRIKELYPSLKED